MDGVKPQSDKLESEVTKDMNNETALKAVYRSYQACKHTAFRNEFITVGDIIDGVYRYEDDIDLIWVVGHQLNYLLDLEARR